jgi:MoaA/NifB/PqqE/SkfB family radical SAM enzyme
MGKPKVTISINPSYFCNFDCEFCYLTPDQLNDKKLLPFNKIQIQIDEVQTLFDISCVDIYGGEVGLLPQSYLENILGLFDEETEINVITNFSKINPAFYDERVNLSVSWESTIRRKSNQVLENMKNFKKDINLLMLAGSEMLSWDDEKIQSIVDTVSSVKSIKTLEIKPYSSNQSNDFGITFLEFENLVKKWMSYSGDYIFVNEENLKSVFSGTSNSFSDNHIYISPAGDLEVLDFDSNDREFFRKVDSVEGYWQWANMEKLTVSNNSFCQKCEYLGSCLSEHLRKVDSVDESCNGFIKLIEWYKEGGHRKNI